MPRNQTRTTADEQSRFCWQGFGIPLNDSWHPTVLRGGFRRGYVQLERSSEGLLQIRWEPAKQTPNLNERAQDYLRLLRQSAKKRKRSLHTHSDGSEFRWHGELKGYGGLLWDEESRRVFLIERSGPSRDSFKQEARAILRGFESFTGDVLPWQVLGLRLRLPARLAMRRFDALAGRIAVRFTSRIETVVAERWSLADRLLAQTSLAEWGAKATRLQPAAEHGDIARYEGAARLPLGLLGVRKTGIALHLSEENALVTLVRVGWGSAPLEEWVIAG